MTSKADRAARDERIQELTAAGRTRASIAAELGCSRSTVAEALDPAAREHRRTVERERKRREAAAKATTPLKTWDLLTVVCHPHVSRPATMETVPRTEFVTRMAGHPVAARHAFDTRFAVITDPAAIQQWKASK